MSSPHEIRFHFDPVCPFAWLTSRWLVKVAEIQNTAVDWRFISLRILNEDKDYARDFPAGYEHGHTAGLRILRVAAAARETSGPEAVGALYTAAGENIFDRPPVADDDRQWLGTADHIAEILRSAGLPTAIADAADDDRHDAVIRTETAEALSRTGRDVGTPIIIVDPPDGPGFFGPVISRVPDTDEEAVALWNSVMHLATFPGFSELKRGLREPPQLRALGDPADEPDLQEWVGGRRIN